MRSATVAFDAAIKAGTGTSCAKLEVYTSDGIIIDTYVHPTVKLIDGTVTQDRSADIRTSLSAKVVDTSGENRSMDFLDPLIGGELVAYRGLLIDGTPEWIRMGKFTIGNVNITHSNNSLVFDITAYDRSHRLKLNPWLLPYRVASGRNIIDVMVEIFNDRAKGFVPEWNVTTTTEVTKDLIYSDTDDPNSVLAKLAQSIGAEQYFDSDGVWCVFPVPDPLTITESAILLPENNMIIDDPQKAITADEVYSGVICRGNAPWLLFAISGEAWDDDPMSDTYYLGPFGKRPKIIEDATVGTDAQCAKIAQAEFLKIKGVTEEVTYDLRPDPRWEVGDVIWTMDDLMRVSGRYVIETLSTPLVGNKMTGTIKRKR